MQEKIKEIVSVFLKISKEQITASTVIDRSAVGSSILIHRMYAKLLAEGIIIKDYQDVQKFDDLLQRVAGNDSLETKKSQNGITDTEITIPASINVLNVNAGVGIDIELISAMPVTNDFREHTFYTMNYSVTEIAYCILQSNPYASFAGLFAAKEAIVKADNSYKDFEFKNINIQHLAANKPFHKSFNISISHTHEMAVAIAIPFRQNKNNLEEIITKTPEKPHNSSFAIWVFLFLSLFLSIISLFLILKQ
jgi:phosphopantetheine--protein transferase-like protein